MNSSSFLLCLVFAAIGYVVHPMILPELVDSRVVAESSLSDAYKKELGIDSGEDASKLGKDTNEGVDPEIEKPDVVEKPAPEPVVTPEPEPEPEPAPVVTPDPVVTPEPDVADVEAVVTLSEEEVINILKASVKASEVNEFSYDQVISWREADEEIIGSDTYQVGMVTYKADTIFDEQELEAKAIIKDGKVDKWLWPTTNTKMR